MTFRADATVFQTLIDDAVAEGVAPGFQCVVFNRDSLIYNGVSGFAAAPIAESPEGKPFKRESLVWIASCSKLALSLIVLHIIERGLTKSGFSINDLDNHEALVEVLPEFKHGSGSLVTKIIEGFEDRVDGDGRRIMKLKNVKGRVTLRMLLTHTAGMSYSWNHPLIAETFSPSDGSVPHFLNRGASGNIRDFENPLVGEPGIAWNYGYVFQPQPVTSFSSSSVSPAADWLGQFAVRSSGKTLRELHKEIIFQPLGIPPAEADLWISPSLSPLRAAMHVRNLTKGFAHCDHDLYSSEGKPAEGKAYVASGCIISSLQAYAKVLQAVLNEDPIILSKQGWEMAIKDDVKARGIKITRPAWKSSVPSVSLDPDGIAKSTIAEGAGVNMLQCHVALAPTMSGRPAGSFAWAGAANTYYFVDSLNGIGAIFGTQLLPFFDSRVVEVRDRLEELVYKTLVHG